jgi:cytosine/adenosine deaminase-related metal-dependent hydrolase
VSEQMKEVNEAISYLGKRPVEWMADQVELTDRFHLVHATHLTPHEVQSIVHSGAHVVLCPTTEGNLGDGLFPLLDYQAAGGCWSIGTDSHVGLDPLEELRLLDYGQRLIHHRRNVFGSPQQSDSGTFAVEMALTSGRKAMGNKSQEWLVPGQPLDAVVYDASHPLMAQATDAQRISILVYSDAGNNRLGTLVNGRWVWKAVE